MASRAASIQRIAAGKGNFGKDLFGVQLEVRFSHMNLELPSPCITDRLGAYHGVWIFRAQHRRARRLGKSRGV